MRCDVFQNHAILVHTACNDIRFTHSNHIVVRIIIHKIALPITCVEVLTCCATKGSIKPHVNGDIYGMLIKFMDLMPIENTVN